MGIQPEFFRGLALQAGSSLIFQTTNPNFALLKNRNLLSHQATKLIPQTGGSIGHKFIDLSTVDSTNNFAMAMVHAGQAEHGMAIFTHEQTRGKGQREKAWLSNPGENITMSVILAPQESFSRQHFLLSMGMAAAGLDFIREYIKEDLAIKWPNDLYWRDQKMGGILIENVFRGNELVCSVAGFGININQTEFDQRILNPVSFRKVTGLSYDPRELGKILCGHIEKKYEGLRSQDPKEIHDYYNEQLYKRKNKVGLKKGNKKFTATISSVNMDGQLITESPPGIYNYAEVEWMVD